MPNQFISQYRTAGIVSQIWRRINHFIELLPVFQIVLQANFFELVIQVIISQWHRNIKPTSCQLLSIYQNFAEFWILIVHNLFIEKLLIHEVLLLCEVGGASNDWLLWILLRLSKHLLFYPLSIDGHLGIFSFFTFAMLILAAQAPAYVI